MEYDSFDESTKRRLAASEKLLSYAPANEKILAFHKSTSKTRLLLGGKRSSKSTSSIVEACWAALGIHPFLDYPPPPLKIRICGVDFGTCKQVILPMLYEWLPRQAIKKFWADDKILELTNGTLIDIKSYDSELQSYEGVERHLCIMDEEPPQSIYQANWMRTISKGINGKLIIACTPIQGMSWIYSTLYDNPEAIPPAVEHWHMSIYENPHLEKASIDAILKDPAMKDNVEAAIYGKFFSHTGLIYPMFNRDKHVIKPLEGGKIPDDWLVVLGIDPHDRNPHGVVICGFTKDSTWIVFDEIYQGGTIDELVKTIKTKLGKRYPPNLAIIDTSANAPQSLTGRSVKEELIQKHGLYLFDAHKDVTAGRLLVSGLLDPGNGADGKPLLPKLYFTENCHNVIRQIKLYQWDDWATRRREKQDPKEKPMKRFDDLCDALRYVVMAEIKYRPPGLTFRPKTPEGVSKVTGYW